MKNKSQNIQRIRVIVTNQSCSLNKKNETNEGELLQSDDVVVSNMRVRKFSIDPQKFEKFTADEVFLTLKD